MSRRHLLPLIPCAVAGALVGLAPALASAQEGPQPRAVAPSSESHGGMIAVHTTDIVLKDGPAALPPGAKFALLEGDPSKAEPITLRLQVPAHYRVPPHFHSGIEHLTILSGTVHMGMGEKAVYEGGTALGVGDYMIVPAGVRHYAWTGDQPATFQLHTVGPWTLTYVNPKDDPRGK